jgi:predicted phage-related endonuclease
LDADVILAKQVEQLEREKKELQAKLKAQEKKVDFFARACHIVRPHAHSLHCDTKCVKNGIDLG